MEPLPLTVCIIAKDAASQIGECLASVRFAAEVLVVDSGSTDATVAIAEREGARVVVHEWQGFGRQKQFAVQGAKHDWVLCLDVDERVTEALAATIRAEMANPRCNAYRLKRRNRFLGVWLNHGEGYPDWTLRLFHRSHASWSNDEVHEAVLTTAQVARLTGDLLHDSAEDIATYLAKQNRYTSLHAEALFKQGVRVSGWKLFVNPVVRFVKFYFVKLGFLDGAAGFAHVAIGCSNTFHKYLKLLELQKASR